MKGPLRKGAENRQSRKKGTCTAAMHASTRSSLSENLVRTGRETLSTIVSDHPVLSLPTSFPEPQATTHLNASLLVE